MGNDKKEICEAIVAGERALNSLYAAQDKLKSDRSWGMIDLFGDGIFTDMIKHDKMDDAIVMVNNILTALKEPELEYERGPHAI